MNLLSFFTEKYAGIDGWMWLVLAAALVLVIVLAVVLLCTKKKAAPVEEVVEAPVVEEPVDEAEPVVEEKQAEPVVTESVVTEPEEEEVADEETVEEPAEEEAVAEEEPAKADTVKVEKPKTKTYYVGKRKDDGKWQVKLGGSRVLKLFDYQKDAIDYARDLAQKAGGSVRVSRADGTFSKRTVKVEKQDNE